MKKTYESPVLVTLTLSAAENILTASEESCDISINFDSLWKS